MDPTNPKPPRLYIEMLALGDVLDCSDPGCEVEASVLIRADDGEKKPWCTGHAHCEISVWMVGL